MPPRPLQEERAAVAPESKCPDGGSARGAGAVAGRGEGCNRLGGPPEDVISMPGCHKGGIEGGFRARMAIGLCPGVEKCLHPRG